MKNYTVIIAQDWSFDISAKSHKDAVSIGRRVCRFTGEKFIRVRLTK